jgi:CDP-diacylglycerol--serine O-phosphatidyltransferase
MIYRNIPNLFTLLNLIFGCVAIVYTLQNGITIFSDAATGMQWVDIPEKIWMASLFIGLAAVVDFLDGFVARLFRVESAMGKQLDSLADVVSFGVAPGMIVYQFLRLSVAQEEDGLNTSMMWLMPAFVLTAAAAWRLAKFNIDNTQAYNFKGVPTPAVGIFIASLPLIYWNINEPWVNDVLRNKWILMALVALLSFLMVCNLPFLALKFRDLSIRNNIPKYLLIAIAIISVITLKWLAVPVIFACYILVSLIFARRLKAAV